MKASEPTNFEVSGSSDQNVIENYFASAKSSRTSAILMKESGEKKEKKEGPTKFFDCSAKKLDGTKVDKIKDLVGDAKAVLVVNVASK